MRASGCSFSSCLLCIMFFKTILLTLSLAGLSCATHYPGELPRLRRACCSLYAFADSQHRRAGLGLHNDNQQGLTINGVPAADRLHWMRIANNAVREINGDPCSIAPFGVAVVNTTSNELVCVAANRVGVVGSKSLVASVPRRALRATQTAVGAARPSAREC